MDQKQRNSHIKKVIVLTISLIVLGVSATYAYFTSSLNEPSLTTGTAGVFKVESSLETTNAIKNRRMVLLDQSDVAEKADHLEFTVTNASDSTVSAQYDIYLRDIQMTRNLESEDFKWELLKKEADGDLTQVSMGNFKGVTETTAVDPAVAEVDRTLVNVNGIKITTNNPIVIAKDTTDTLVFRLYILNAPDRNQISLTEGSFQGRLYLEAAPVSELKTANQEVVQP